MAHDGKIRFGIFSPLSGLTFDALTARANLAERLGYHSIWLDDHMWTRAMPEIDHLDCVAALAAAGRAYRAIAAGHPGDLQRLSQSGDAGQVAVRS